MLVHKYIQYSYIFREIVDSKCYSLAYEFVCQLLQPVCYQQKTVLPCRDFCGEFMESCGNILPKNLREQIQCEAMATESDGPGACISTPSMRIFKKQLEIIST